ncbi:Phytocyanin domain [Dillenia turbinata]|uniref:Phytocyanin domain n=1 Tax=Dillenia turbinata TaxID=194707 RepID=A0AAN8UAZ7_9MAGN
MGSVQSSQEFKVGDINGWREPDPKNFQFYILWASRYTFYVGDSLNFEYNNDSVLVVGKWDYYHCNTDKPIFAFSNGKNIINLDRAGPFYFISGVPEHCKNGQRLLINVETHDFSPPQPYMVVSPSPSPLLSSEALARLTLAHVLVGLVASLLLPEYLYF